MLTWYWIQASRAVVPFWLMQIISGIAKVSSGNSQIEIDIRKYSVNCLVSMTWCIVDIKRKISIVGDGNQTTIDIFLSIANTTRRQKKKASRVLVLVHDQVSVEECYSSFSISICLKPTSIGHKYQSSGGKDYFFYLIAGYSQFEKRTDSRIRSERFSKVFSRKL